MIDGGVRLGRSNVAVQERPWSQPDEARRSIVDLAFKDLLLGMSVRVTWFFARSVTFLVSRT